MKFLPRFRFVRFVYLLLRQEMWSWDTFSVFDRAIPWTSSEVKIYYFCRRWKAQPVDMLEQKLSKQKRENGYPWDFVLVLSNYQLYYIPQGPKYIPTTKVILLWSLFFFIVNFTDVVGILRRFSAQVYITRAGTLTKYKNILANILRPAVMKRGRISYEGF